METLPLIKSHITRLNDLEDQQARKMLKLYREAFKQLTNDLKTTPDNTYTEAKLKATLAQIEVYIKAMEKQIKGQVKEGFDISTMQSAEDAVSEINKLEKEYMGINPNIPVDAIIDSTDPRNILLNNYASSMASYSEGMRSSIQQSLTQSLIQGSNYSQSVDKISQILLGNEWRAHRIVRTELHSIYNIAKMDNFGTIRDKYFPDLQKMLIHKMDNRTADDSKELAKQNPIVDIDEPFVQVYEGKKYVFMAPPNRPNDRAILIPFRKAYIESNK